MSYQMTATAVTLNDLEGHSLVAGLFKCSPSKICTAFYLVSADSVLARFLCISRPSCFASGVYIIKLQLYCYYLFISSLYLFFSAVS